VEELDLEVVEELALEEFNFEREGSSAQDGGRSAARGTTADAHGGPTGAQARPGRRAGQSSITAGEEGRPELEHDRGGGPAGAQVRPGTTEVDAEAGAGVTEAESRGGGGVEGGGGGAWPVARKLQFWIICPGNHFRRIETTGGVLQKNI
jgi:hypothetical protein